MTIEEMTAKLNEANAVIPGKRIKLDHGDAGAVLLDGVAGSVSNTDGGADADADAVISVSWDDWKAIAKGELDPVSAFMSGKLRVQGDMSLAMQLQGLLAKVRG